MMVFQRIVLECLFLKQKKVKKLLDSKTVFPKIVLENRDSKTVFHRIRLRMCFF